MVFDFDAYSDIHRATLQTLMSHGTMEEERFHQVFKLICEKLHPQLQLDNEATLKKGLHSTIEKINENISCFDQKIVKQQYGLNQNEYYIFASNTKTSIAKLQNCFSESETEYFKQIFNHIVGNEDLSIAPREALNLQMGIKVSKQRAEKLIEAWIAAGYFYRNNNLIYLGPRSIAEFIEVIQSMGLDYLRSCGLCEEIAAWGETCGSCKTATFHKKCIEKFLARSQKCPTCKKKWTLSMEQ